MIQITITCATALEAAKIFERLHSDRLDIDNPLGTDISSPASVLPEETPAPKARAKPGPKPKAKAKAKAKAEAEPATETPVITFDDLKIALRAALDLVGDVAVRPVFKKHKAAKLSDLAESNYAAFLKDLNIAKELPL